MTLQMSDYLDNYLKLCYDTGCFIVPSFRRQLESAVHGGPVPETFKLNGNQPDLSQSRLTDSYVPIILTPLSRSGVILRELDLSCNEIGDEGAKALATFLRDDMTLESLDLHANSIGPKGIVALTRALHVNERLTFLDLSDNVAGEDGGMEIANMLQINSSLTQLRILNVSMTANGFIALSTVMRNNTTLTHLNISNNHAHTTTLTQSLANDVMMHLTRMLSTNYALKEIECAKMGISDWMVREYWERALSSNMRIGLVDLSCNRITRDGGVAICRALHNHSSLAVLKLSCCSIQDEGAEAISQMLQNNFSLQSLWLDYNAITGKGLIAIAQSLTKNFSLKQIKVWGNKWDVPACEAWSKLLGGPVVNVSYGDDLSGYLVEPGDPFPSDGRRTISVRAQSAKERREIVGMGSLQQKNLFDMKPSQRFKNSNLDVTFYSVEGVLAVARRH